MTNSPNVNPPQEPNPRRRWWRLLFLSGAGFGFLALIVALVATWWVRERLAPLVETQISQLLKRPVQVGRLETFTLNGLRFGTSSLPATPTDPDHAKAEAVDVRFSLGDLIFRRTLKLEITLVNPDAYIQQDPNGQWINTETAKGPQGFLKTEIDTIGLVNADATLVPNPVVGQKTSAPIVVNLKTGRVRIREQNQRILYDLNGSFSTGGNFRVDADSLLPTGETKVQLQGQNLPVTDLARLLKAPAITLQAGRGNGNLSVQLRQSRVADITGVASFQGVQARINPLKEPVRNAIGQVRFRGTTLTVDRLNASYGQVPLKIAGSLTTGPNFDLAPTKFNLVANVEPVTVATLLAVARRELGQTLQLPVSVAGTVKVDSKLTGTLAQPVLTGAIAATEPVQVDRVQLNALSTNFQIERGRDLKATDSTEATQRPETDIVVPSSPAPPRPNSIPAFSSLILSLKELRITPTVGGQIAGNGQVEIALEPKTPSGLVLDVQVQNLPTDTIARLYNVTAPVTLGNLSANAQIFGPLNNLQGRVRWQAPQATYPASGELRIARATADLQNVVLSVAGGTVNLSATLSNRQWQVLAAADRIALDRLRQELPALQVPSSLAGLLSGRVLASGSLDNFALNAITVNGNSSLAVEGGSIDTRGQLQAGRWQLFADAESFEIDRLLDLATPVLEYATTTGRVNPAQANRLNTQVQALRSLEGSLTGQATASGTVDNFQLSTISGNANGRFNVANGVITARAKAEAGRWQLFADANAVDLTGLVETIEGTKLVALPASLPAGISGRLFGQVQASGSLTNLTANAITATANGRLLTNQIGAITANAQVTNGRWDASLRTNEVLLSRLQRLLQSSGLLTTALPADLEGLLAGRVQFLGSLNNLTANGISGKGDGQLRLTNGGGIVNANGQVAAGNWRVSVAGDQIALSRFQQAWEQLQAQLQGRGVLAQAQSLPILRGLFTGSADLSGTLANLTPQAIQAVGRLRISQLPYLNQPFAALFNWNGRRVEVEQATTQGLQANGFFGVEFTGRGLPSISNLDFNLKLSNFELESLPLPLPSALAEFQGNTTPLAGRLNFNGRLSGPLANLNLAGDVRLQNLAVNQVAFEPVLAGTLTAGLGQGLDLRLKGQQDRIEVALNQSFLPTSFAIQRGEAIALGRTEGDTLRVNLEAFPLATLNLAPAKQYGLGIISGLATGQVSIPGWRQPLNLAGLQATGQLAIAQPAIGYIKGDQFEGEFSYANKVATLTRGEFRLGQSLYSLTGNVALSANPQFQGNLKVQQGNLQDILVALRYFNVNDFARGLKPPVYGTAQDVQTVAVGVPDAPLIEQLRRFAEIRALLAQQQEAQADSKLPPLSELQALFNGEVTVAGSLQTGLEASFNVKGDNWRWGRYLAEEFSLEGNFQNGVLTVLPLRIQSGETLIGFSGTLGQQGQSGQLRIKDISVEDLAKWIELPYVDVTGRLNVRATLGGTLQNPQAIGELSLLEGILNREPIERAEGSFSYNNARLNFSGNALITETEPIEVLGSLPFELPFATAKADSDQIDLRLNLKNEGLAIINVLTPQISWVEGQANVQVRVSGTLQQPLAEGIASFENATVRARAFPEPLTNLAGTVRFEGDRIRVSGVQGQLSQGQVTAAGVIPLSQPFAAEDADLATPLTVALNQLALNLRGLYRGGATGTVQVVGTALRPVLGGAIELYDGQVFLSGAGVSTQLVSSPGTGTAGLFEVGFNNLQLNLRRGIQVTSPPILNFQATGGLTVNGTLDEIRPQGTIRLTAGAVNLFTTQFRLDRGYPQTATFVPSQGLDPTLDVRLVTSVPEVTRFRTPSSALSSEIADEPTTTTGSVRTVRIQALVQGRASQLAENLELRSSPGRSETEIVALLGGSFVETLGQGDGTLAIANLAGAGLFSNLQSVITNATGLSEFRLFPTRIRRDDDRASSSSTLGLGLEVGMDITRNLSASIVRVLAANQPTEFTLRYRLSDELLLRGSTNFQGDNRATIEYEVRF